MGWIEQLGAWPARTLWALLAVVSGGTFGDALQGRSSAVAIVAAALLWAGWGAGLVALLVPRSASLTAVRVLVPASVVAVAAAASVGGHPSAWDVIALVVAALAAMAALAPWVAEGFVDGSAYGPERRTPLRTPPLLLAVATLTWFVIVAGATAGPLLLGARSWAVGGVVLVVGWLLAFASVRSLHQLARRWVVIVPAGLVVHDPLTMPEPQLFLRQGIARVGPAHDDDDPAAAAMVTEDLTAGAAGLALELVLREPVELLVRTGRTEAETRAVDRVLFTPSRPAAVLDAARDRRIPVG